MYGKKTTARTVSLVLAALMILTACSLSGCGLMRYEDYLSEESRYEAGQSGETAPPQGSEAEGSPEPGSSGADETSAEAADTGESSQPEEEPLTGFEAAVKNNPLDADYAKESDRAETAADIVRVNRKFAERWLDEVRNAYSVIMEGEDEPLREAVEKSQSEWEATLEEKTESILAEAEDEGGSVASMSGTAGVLQYHRKRALELYAYIYESDGTVPFYYLK